MCIGVFEVVKFHTKRHRAEFERALIRERQREGIAIAKSKGVYKGRKPVLDEGLIAKLREMAMKGMPKTEIAQAFAISRASVYHYLRSL